MGLISGVARGAVFIDHTTASAEIARELHAEAKKRGFDFIDAPVSGGQAGAENGVLTVMCGGDAEPYARAEKVIAAYARMCKLLGAAGAGQLTKMVNQICIAGLVQGLAEGIHFAKKAGPRRRGGDRDDLQGRRAVLADGEPLQDHDGWESSISALPSTGCARIFRSASAKRARMARACRSRHWSISSMPRCRRWAAGAGIRRA